MNTELDSVVLNLKIAICQYLFVLIKADFIWCSYATKFSAMYLKMEFYIDIISLLDCLNMHVHMHSQAHAQRNEEHSCSNVQLAVLLSSQAFVKKQFFFQGCRRNLGQVSCSYATAANVLWGSKESASCGRTWYVIIAREQGIKEQEFNETPSLCSVLGNTCLKYV